MQVCLAGNNVNGAYAFKNAADRLSASFIHITAEEKNIKKTISHLIDITMDFYIIDLSSFDDDEEEIVRQVHKLWQSVNSNIIIFAPGHLSDSRILNSFRAVGINRIITESSNIGNMMKQLEFFLNGKNISNEEEQEKLISMRENAHIKLMEENPNLQKIEKLDDAYKSDSELFSMLSKKNTRTIKIAVIGSKRNIGTTTTAIQFVKYLNGIEPGTAAYLEYNQTGYVNNLNNTYNVDREIPELGCIFYKNVEMYFNPRLLSQIPNYNYLIYDYGSVEDIVDLSSIYEKDLILLVGGAKPNANELGKMTFAMKMLYDQKNTFYVFNFIHPQDREMVIKLNEGRKDKTFFLEYAPNPFLYNRENGYMFKDILNTPTETIEKKKGILQKIFPKG